MRKKALMRAGTRTAQVCITLQPLLLICLVASLNCVSHQEDGANSGHPPWVTWAAQRACAGESITEACLPVAAVLGAVRYAARVSGALGALGALRTVHMFRAVSYVRGVLSGLEGI